MLDLSQRNFNMPLSPPDDRDFRVGDFIPSRDEYPETFSVSALPNVVYDQYKTAKCVAYASKNVIESFNIKEFGVEVPVSVDFIFSNRYPDQLSSVLMADEGTYPREIVSNIVKDGVCEDKLLPTRQPDTLDQIVDVLLTAKLRENAQLYRAHSFFRAAGAEDIKKALMSLDAPVIASIPVRRTKFKGDYCESITSDYKTYPDFAGHHMITICGWHKKEGIEYWDILNSYGGTFGNYGGWVFLPTDSYFDEVWVMSDKVLNNKNFVALLKQGAIDSYRKQGILPSITFAQASLESAWGNKAPGYNLFGIKWSAGCGYDKQLLWTKEYQDGKWVSVQAYFRKYNSYAESIADHGRLLSYKRYAAVRSTDNYKDACYALQEAGYATDPGYARKLIGRIENFNLSLYDRGGYKMYKDFDDVADWAKAYVEQATKLGIFNGDSNGNFNPKNPITREQMAKVIVELYNKVK